MIYSFAARTITEKALMRLFRWLLRRYGPVVVVTILETVSIEVLKKIAWRFFGGRVGGVVVR